MQHNKWAAHAAILILLGAAAAFGAGQVSVMDPITKLPKYLKGGDGININGSTNTITATGTPTGFINYTTTDRPARSEVATAAQGAKVDILAPAIIYPSGNATTDLANIQAAIDALPNNGGTVYLYNSGSFNLPAGSTGIQIGNGTNLANSTKHGIRLVGIGKGGTVNGGRGGVIINSAVAGPAIQVNGPLAGWEVDGIEINITSTSTAARGLKVISAQAGRIPYFACDISNPSQIAVEETTTTNTGTAGSNTMQNKWGHVHVWMSSAATNAVAWKSTGAAYPTFNTCNETVDNLEVYTNHASQTGVVLGAADTVSFRQYILWNSGTASKGIVFDYANGQSTGWPADCTFFSMDIGTSTVTNNGVPSGATKNKIFGMGLTNGGSIPSLENLYTGDAPSLADLLDWPAAVSATEVGYLDGVTSSIQTQISGKVSGSLVTTVGSPGSDTNVPSEKAVRSAIAASSSGLSDPGSNGIVKRTSTNTTSVAGYGDVVGLFGGGTCSGYLKNDGSCSTMAGGNMTNTGTPAVGQVPKYTDTTGTALQPGYSVGFGANNLLQLNGSGNIFLKATDGTNTQLQLQARNGGGSIVSDWLISSTLTPQLTFYDAINLHNVLALTPGAPENSFFMDSAGKIGFGTASPQFNLHTVSSASQSAVLLLEQYFSGSGASGGVFGRFGRGSAASPLRGKSGDRIFSIGARSTYAADDISAGAFPGGNRVAINFFNAEDQTSTAQGSYISLLTEPTGANGSPTEKLRVGANGIAFFSTTDPGAGNINNPSGAQTTSTTIDTLLNQGATISSSGATSLTITNVVAGRYFDFKVASSGGGAISIATLTPTWVTGAPASITAGKSSWFVCKGTGVNAADCVVIKENF